ncbi:MAG: 3-phosphoserine/phosphohydroxythreonine transaminase [Bacteroidota bacterium]
MVYNFSAGPAVLPQEVLKKAQAELLDYQGSGMSVMEMSHRSAIFVDIMERAEASLRELMQIPDDYFVLFLQGGATTQFSMVPLNLFRNRKADYIDTGVWSVKAIAEASRFGQSNVVASSKADNFTYIPQTKREMFDPEADYVHITTNNTIYGTTMWELPNTADVPLVADMSSNILSQAYRVEDFGLIYAGAQKNIGPAGLTIVIVRKDLVGTPLAQTPLMLDYATHAKKKSAYNTPPSFAIYMAGLVFDWIKSVGGVAEMARRNQAKAAALYDFLDQSSLFSGTVNPADRSMMNVCFRTDSTEMDQNFLQAAEAVGLKTLKGHRLVGGMRASLYNPMPLEGVQALVNFMRDFEKKA